jgi:hypothetical protein
MSECLDAKADGTGFRQQKFDTSKAGNGVAKARALTATPGNPNDDIAEGETRMIEYGDEIPISCAKASTTPTENCRFFNVQVAARLGGAQWSPLAGSPTELPTPGGPGGDCVATAWTCSEGLATIRMPNLATTATANFGRLVRTFPAVSGCSISESGEATWGGDIDDPNRFYCVYTASGILTVVPTPTSYGRAIGNPADIVIGKPYTITAQANVGYEFTNWSIASGGNYLTDESRLAILGSSSSDITMNNIKFGIVGDVRLVANFKGQNKQIKYVTGDATNNYYEASSLYQGDKWAATTGDEQELAMIAKYFEVETGKAGYVFNQALTAGINPGYHVVGFRDVENLNQGKYYKYKSDCTGDTDGYGDRSGSSLDNALCAFLMPALMSPSSLFTSLINTQFSTAFRPLGIAIPNKL